MKEYYELLGLNETATDEEILADNLSAALPDVDDSLFTGYADGELSVVMPARFSEDDRYLYQNKHVEPLVKGVRVYDYATMEITYKCSPETSKKAINLQVFYAAGSIKNPDAGHQVMKSIKKDGEYHTITIDLTTLKDWDGNINTIRVDFFDQSEVGDTMYIKSIKLIKK